MGKCSTSHVRIQKGEKFSLMQCQRMIWNENRWRISLMHLVGSLMYDQTCMRPNIGFVVSMFGTKKVLRYLQEIKNHVLTYKMFDHLKEIGYKDSNFVSCTNIRKFTFCYVYL